MSDKKLTPDEFAALLQTVEGRLLKATAKSLSMIAMMTINKATKNFTGDDLPDVARVRNTSKSRTGGPVGSTYRKSIKTGNSGYMVGPRRLTGNLSRSFTHKFTNNPEGLQVWVMAGFGKAVKYAAPLEYGSPSRHIMPRFYLGRAVRDVEKDEANKELFKTLNIAIVGKEF